jgi:hypothetical protein
MSTFAIKQIFREIRAHQKMRAEQRAATAERVALLAQACADASHRLRTNQITEHDLTTFLRRLDAAREWIEAELSDLDNDKMKSC